MSVALAAPPSTSLVLATLIDSQRAIILGVLEEASKRPKAKGIHALRVAVRRLLAALELAAALGYSVKSRTPARLRRLMTKLSPLRDLQVQMRALEPYLAEHAPTQAMLDELRARRKERKRKVGRKLAAFDANDFEQDVSSVTGALGGTTGMAEPAVAAVLLGELGKRHLKIDRQRRNAPEDDPEALHRMRLDFKSYRYALEALAPLGSSTTQEIVARIARLQDELGDAHDAHVLFETARTFRESVAPRDAGDIDAWIADLEQKSQRAHRDVARRLRSETLAWPPLS
jgi:CHAD domain-containing protein